MKGLLQPGEVCFAGVSSPEHPQRPRVFNGVVTALPVGKIVGKAPGPRQAECPQLLRRLPRNQFGDYGHSCWGPAAVWAWQCPLQLNICSGQNDGFPKTHMSTTSENLFLRCTTGQRGVEVADGTKVTWSTDLNIGRGARITQGRSKLPQESLQAERGTEGSVSE